MKPSELVTFLSAAIRNRLPVLLQGAPGIGKSDIVEQATKANDADLILSHPAVADPTDAKGLPWVIKQVNGPNAGEMCATFLPFGELSRAIHADKPTVWFLDDLGQASPAVQASYMQLLLARRVNGHMLSDHVTFIAATNRRTDRAGVSGILEPVKSRFGSIVELTPDLDEWCGWAIDHNLPAELIAFMRFKPELLSDFKPTNDLSNSPSPRTWSHAARILSLGLPTPIQTAALCGAVGEGAAIEFTAFLRMWNELPSIDAILLDPMNAKVPDQPATLYAVCSALAMRATKDNFDRISQYFSRLVAANHSEFGVLLIRDAQRRDKSIIQSQAFVRLATGELGSLIS